MKYAPVAQLDRASGYGPEGLGFESLRAYHFLVLTSLKAPVLRLFCFTPLIHHDTQFSALTLQREFEDFL